MPQKTPIKNIVIIGSGNVATHMAKAIKNAGYTIWQVFSKQKINATLLAKEVSAQAINTVNAIRPDADLYIVAVNDDAIQELASTLKLRNKIIVHTSGSTHIDALKKTSTKRGVIYPLQTFSKKTALRFNEVPLFIEANDKKTENILFHFSRNLSSEIHKANSEKRKLIHLAAVFACNFSNHMYAIAEEIANDNKIPFSLFSSLIKETSTKAIKGSPQKAQTGPAIRNDKKILKLQEKLLSDKPEVKKIYKLISKNIRKS